jgi:hypothetical protein
VIFADRFPQKLLASLIKNPLKLAFQPFPSQNIKDQLFHSGLDPRAAWPRHTVHYSERFKSGRIAYRPLEEHPAAPRRGG